MAQDGGSMSCDHERENDDLSSAVDRLHRVYSGEPEREVYSPDTGPGWTNAQIARQRVYQGIREDQAQVAVAYVRLMKLGIDSALAAFTSEHASCYRS